MTSGSSQEKGIAHYALEFEDCTVQPKDIVSEFFWIVDSTVGVLAIHCKVSSPMEATTQPHAVGCVGQAALIQATRLSDEAPLHLQAGLGRTGTMIALGTKSGSGK